MPQTGNTFSRRAFMTGLAASAVCAATVAPPLSVAAPLPPQISAKAALTTWRHKQFMERLRSFSVANADWHQRIQRECEIFGPWPSNSKYFVCPGVHVPGAPADHDVGDNHDEPVTVYLWRGKRHDATNTNDMPVLKAIPRSLRDIQGIAHEISIAQWQGEKPYVFVLVREPEGLVKKQIRNSFLKKARSVLVTERPVLWGRLVGAEKIATFASGSIHEGAECDCRTGDARLDALLKGYSLHGNDKGGDMYYRLQHCLAESRWHSISGARRKASGPLLAPVFAQSAIHTALLA